MLRRSRRDFLKAVATGVGLSIIGPLTAGEPEHRTGKLEPFPLASVRISRGIFQEQEEINARYLDSLSVDRLLHSFRLGRIRTFVFGVDSVNGRVLKAGDAIGKLRGGSTSLRTSGLTQPNTYGDYGIGFLFGSAELIADLPFSSQNPVSQA